MIKVTRKIPDGKQVLKALPIRHYLDAKFLYYPMTSVRCPEGESCVIDGQDVKVGEMIGTRIASFFEQPIHSTVSGKIIGVEKRVDQTGTLVDCLVIKNDLKYELHPLIKERSDQEIAELTKVDFVRIAKEKGLVGLGGGAFPTFIKLNSDYPIHTVVANGIECEPHLISDHELMMTNPDGVIKGLIYAMKAVGADHGVIAIKAKYTEVYECFKKALQSYPDYNLDVVNAGNHYPQGWEIETVESAIGIRVPQGELLSKYGVLNLNVSTMESLYMAVKHDLPLLERFFSVSGNGIVNGNFRVRIGTPARDLIGLLGGYLNATHDKTMILGGQMMGESVTSDDVVITNTSTSLIITDHEKIVSENCVRCASCVYSCPVGLKPVEIMNACHVNDLNDLIDLSVKNCIECGLCSFVCPSKIALTDFMKMGKKILREGEQANANS